MMKVKMTVHEALAELKQLDSRINSAILESVFVFANKHSNAKINGIPVAEKVEDGNRSYQAIMDLINRRKAMRAALSLSNATTLVEINGVTYSVAEAIEMKKNGMNNYHSILNTLTRQARESINACERNNNQLETKADDYVRGLFGGKENVKSAEAMTVREAYITANTFEIESISGLKEKMEKLRDDITLFETKVDSALSVSNAITVIEFEY